MKVSKQFLAVILVVVIACVLIVTAILLLRTPIVLQNDWIGAHPIDTTTPTLTLFPDQGWWTAMPTAPGLGGIPTPTFTKTPSSQGIPTTRP